MKRKTVKKQIAKLSAFQNRVLAVVKTIPRGRVMTYGEVAQMIGQPRAARAVGNALHKNPWPVKIPCHRVVKVNGEIGGYISGKNKKMKLLRSEGVVIIKRKLLNK